MPQVQNGRFTADVSSLGDEVIVFLIGMRINPRAPASRRAGYRVDGPPLPANDWC